MDNPAEIHSRFRVVGAPVDAPGHCGVCGSTNSSDRDFVEFGLKTPYNTGDPYRPMGNGKLYLCTFCVAEAATRMGVLVENSETVTLEAYEAIIEENNRLKSLIDGEFVDNWRDNIEPAFGLLVDILYPDLDDVPEVVSEDSEPADGTPVKSGKHNRKQGPADVSSITNTPDFSL